MSKKFKVISGFSSIPIDTILSPNDKGDYVYNFKVGHITLDLDSLENLIGEYVEYYEPIKVEVSKSELDDTEVSNWKIVMNVRCTEKRLSEIKKIIENNLNI